MGDELVISVDSAGVDTSKVILATIFNMSRYDFSKALPIYVSPCERLVKRKIEEFTGLAKITAPYIIKSANITSAKSSIIDAKTINQKNSYECMKIPRTYLGSEYISLDTLLRIPDSDFVGIRSYNFNPFDESGCKGFCDLFEKDLTALNFCDREMSERFSILVAEAFREQKYIPMPDEKPVLLYTLIIDHKPVENSKNIKINGNNMDGKNIYLLHCNSSNNNHKI